MTFREFYEKTPRVQKQPLDYFRLIPQDGVRRVIVEQEPEHNAIWDMNVRKSDGRVFFSVCGEGMIPLYARLYEYIPGEARAIRHFALEDAVIQRGRTIRASKFHTAIQFLDDGRLVLQTHTTSPSPLHPTWMPESYLNHQWESFEGSELMFYDPDTHRVDYKGVVSPFCSLYGGGLSKRAGVYVGVGIFNGVGYLYDLKTNAVTELGQITDGRTNRFYEGPDGHLYYGTATGDLARVNVDTRKAEILAKLEERSPLRHGAFDENGTLWFSTRAGKLLYTYNVYSGEFAVARRFFPDDEYAPATRFCYGFDFDSSGCMWFCANQDGNRELPSPVNYRAGVRLYKWDVRHGKRPVDFGFVGTPERSVALCAQASICGDRLFVTDGNHLDDPVGIIEIDLSKMTEDKITSARPLSNDPIVYMCCDGAREQFPLGPEEYDRRMEHVLRFCSDTYADAQVQDDNCSYAKFSEMTGAALWESVGYGNGSVRALRWKDDETLEGVCGGGERYRFSIKYENGAARVESAVRDDAAPDQDPLAAAVPDGLTLPCMPGRQFLARAESSAALADGSIVIGTKDMMLCRVKDGKVFGLGAVTTSGGVHCLSVAPDGKTVYGVAGYECGKGDVFRYSEDTGLFWLGSVPITTTPTGRQLVSGRPWICAVSPDGRHLAIGSLDEMSGVGVYTL